MTPEKTTPSPELTAFSIANSPKPTISAEGQAAKDRIAAAKAARNNTTITSGDLQSQPQFKLTPPAPAVQADGLQAVIGQEAQDAFTKAQQDATSQAQTQSKSAKDSFLDAEMKRIGFTGFQSQLESNPEFTATQNELQDINQQIREEDLALRRATERIVSQGGQSKGQAQSQINNLTRDSLSRQADLSIIQLGKQAKYDSAVARIDRKAKALFEQENNTIEALKFNYQENKELFTKAEQRLFETNLGDRERKLQADIDNRKEIDTLALEAQKGDAPTNIVQQMLAAKTKEEAIGLGGQFIGALDREAKRASIRASNASANRNEIGALIDLAEAGDANAIAQLGITQPDQSVPTSDEIAFARQYAATGQVPAGLSSSGVSFGRISEIAGDLPKPVGALVDRNTNVVPSNLSATDGAAFDALYNAINTDLPVIRQAWKEMNSFNNFAGTGIIGGVTSTIFPSDANTRFETAKADFTAKLVLARSGAAATEDEVARYQALLPGRFNTPIGLGTDGTQKLNALETQMTSAFDDKLNSRGLAVHGYSKIKVGEEEYTVGEIITNEYGQQGRVNPDSSITLINQ